MRGMKNRKEPGTSGVSSDMLKRPGRTGVRELTKVYQKILKQESGPGQRRNRCTIPV